MEITTGPVNISVEAVVTMADDWHPLDDKSWPIPDNSYILAQYCDGPKITVNSSFVRANKTHFCRWRTIPA